MLEAMNTPVPRKLHLGTPDCRGAAVGAGDRPPRLQPPAQERDRDVTDQLSKPRFRLGFLTHVQGRGDPVATYRNAQELFVVADELVFEVGWVAQHHAPLGGGGLASPRTVPSRAAAPTQAHRP